MSDLCCVRLPSGEPGPGVTQRGDGPRAAWRARLLVLLIVGSASAALADDSQDLARIEASFVAQRPGAIAWYAGWVGFNALNAGVAFWQLAESEQQLARDAWLMSGLGSALYVALAAVDPLPGMYGARRVRRYRASTSLSQSEKVRRAEALLEHAALSERLNSNWLCRVLGWSYAIASSAYIYFRNRDAPTNDLALAVGLQFATTAIVVEGAIWSAPRKARRDLAAYRADHPSGEHNDLQQASLRVRLGVGQVELRLSY